MGDLTDDWIQMRGDDFTCRVDVKTVGFGVIK